MGIDYEAKLFYGTQNENVMKNLPVIIQEELETDYEICPPDHNGPYTKEEKALKEFEGFSVSIDSWSCDFLAFGVSLDPANEDMSDVALIYIDKIFKKYRLGKASFHLFVETS
jgi:hypothetical protein